MVSCSQTPKTYQRQNAGDMSIQQISEILTAGEISSVQLVQNALDKYKQNERYNSVISIAVAVDKLFNPAQ